MLECLRVARVLQSYLDGTTDDVTRRRVARHLDMCRRCGLRAYTYLAIKAALTRRQPPPPLVLTRLREFADTLIKDGADPPGAVG